MPFRWLFMALGLALPMPAQWTIPWSYEGPRGPEHWAGLDPAYAACNGQQQSPIDIRAARKAALPALRFDYHPAPLDYLLNNGHTVRVNYHGSADYLIVDGARYQLTQFHFHRPSEEQVHGKSFDMVIHLMHESSDPGGKKVAGVAVLLQAGQPNATIQKIWDHMPLAQGPEHAIPGVNIDPAALLPRDLSYYMYTGSITAPPCDESVLWLVLKTPIQLSREQIDAFAKLYPHNVRPPQPLNGRIVQETP